MYNINIDTFFIHSYREGESCQPHLRESLDSERNSLLESADQKIPIFENMQLELESERAKVKDLKNSVEREKQRLQSQVTALESQTSVLKDELEQERLACRQMKNEIDQIQVNECGVIVSHNEHHHDHLSIFLSTF